MPEAVLERVTTWMSYNGCEHVKVGGRNERTTRLASLRTGTPHGCHTQGTRGGRRSVVCRRVHEKLEARCETSFVSHPGSVGRPRRKAEDMRSMRGQVADGAVSVR